MNSFIAWIGGKRLLRDKIVNLFPADLKQYIEVFGGAGWVLFHKEKHADSEIYNDFNSDVVNLFRCVKFHRSELQRELQWYLNSREFFEDFKEQNTVRGMTDIQRAARFFMLIKTSYGADKKSYGCVKKSILNTIKYLESIQKRLENVVVEHQDFETLIKHYNNEKTLFYLDPPYHGTEKYYTGFDDADHIRLKQCLKGIKGYFILSYNDDKFIRDLYKEYTIIEVSRLNNLVVMQDRKDKQYKELIIKNF